MSETQRKKVILNHFTIFFQFHFKPKNNNTKILSGADEIITFSNDSFETNFYEKSIEQSSFLNELLSRNDRYDVVFITTHLNYNTEFIKKFVTPAGVLIHATEKDLPSDDYGAFKKMLFTVMSSLNCNNA